MKQLEVIGPRGRRGRVAQYEPHEWAALPWHMKALSWLYFVGAVARGWRPK